jgi:ketosteroid isomerase-like protein
MSAENVEVVRRLYDAVARRDTEAILELYDPEIEWDGSRNRWAEVMTSHAIWKGHDDLRKFFRAYYEMWESFEDDLEELIDAGDHVVTVVNSRGRGRESGLEVEWVGNAGVWTVRDGRIIRVVWFATREEAMEAAEGQG